MPYFIRPMHKEDIPQVMEIDREVFPTQWPPPNYHHELQLQLARYLVATDATKTLEAPEVKAEEPPHGLLSGARRWLRGSRFFSHNLPATAREYVIGFAGMWVMADEAHITNIAVRGHYQRRGIGELLLISLIDLANELNASFLTLEVRASNTVAQRLYAKLGFTEVGVRRCYYLDNKEDALLMSTPGITSTPFQEQFQQRKQDYFQKRQVNAYQPLRNYRPRPEPQ